MQKVFAALSKSTAPSGETAWGNASLAAADRPGRPVVLAGLHGFPAAVVSEWDYVLMVQDDPEQPAAQRRFVARIIPNARQNLITWALLSAGAVLLLVGGVVLTSAAPTNPALIPIVMLLGLVALVALTLLALRRLWANKVAISITGVGLTIDRRPGDVFPFRDAELGQWRGLRQRGPELGGRALCLTCGPHRFVLGSFDRRVASQLPPEGPQVGWENLDALMPPQHFDELLAALGRRS